MNIFLHYKVLDKLDYSFLDSTSELLKAHWAEAVYLEFDNFSEKSISEYYLKTSRETNNCVLWVDIKTELTALNPNLIESFIKANTTCKIIMDESAQFGQMFQHKYSNQVFLLSEKNKFPLEVLQRIWKS